MTAVLWYASPVFSLLYSLYFFVSRKCRVSWNKPQTQWEFREIIKRPPHCSTTAPFPHLSLFTGKRGIAFLQTPPIRYLRTHQGSSRAALSDPAGVKTGGERWGLKHTALVVSLTTQTPDKTTTDRLCRLNKGVCACQQGKRLDTVIVVLF